MGWTPILTNAMDILVDTTIVLAWEIEVDDMHDVLDVESTSRNSCCDENWGLGSTEGASFRTLI